MNLPFRRCSGVLIKGCVKTFSLSLDFITNTYEYIVFGGVRVMDKKSAAQLLGVTTRTIEKYSRDGKLSVTYTQLKHGRQANYNESELLALKDELESVVHRSIVTTNTPESAISEVFGGSENQLQLLRLVAALVVTQSLSKKMVLSLDEAAEVSGLARSHLMNAAKSGKLNAQIIGRGWKVRSVDLQIYVDELFANK